MKPELYRAINNRDGAAMASIAGGNSEHGRVVNSDAERLVDALFMQLKQIFPAATQTNLRSDADERVAKQQWIPGQMATSSTTPKLHFRNKPCL